MPKKPAKLTQNEYEELEEYLLLCLSNYSRAQSSSDDTLIRVGEEYIESPTLSARTEESFDIPSEIKFNIRMIALYGIRKSMGDLAYLYK